MKNCLIAAFALALLLICAFIILVVSATELVRSALPFGQQEVQEWMMRDYVEGPYSDPLYVPVVPMEVWSGGQFDPEGPIYEDDQTAVCRIPVDRGWQSGYYFGQPLDYGGHGGVDYGGDPEVHAIMGGVVVFDGWYDGYGHIIIIENDGYMFYYGHLQCGPGTGYGEYIKSCAPGWTPKYKPGDIVQTDDVIGLMGSTGNSTGTHLHFEVRLWNPDENRWVPRNPATTMLPGLLEFCDALKSGPKK